MKDPQNSEVISSKISSFLQEKKSKIIIIVLIILVIYSVGFISKINKQMIKTNQILQSEKLKNKNNIDIINKQSKFINTQKSDIDKLNKDIKNQNNQIEDLKKKLISKQKQKKLLAMKKSTSQNISKTNNTNNISRGNNVNCIGTFKLTFYTAYQGSPSGLTKMGTPVEPGNTIAVDPSVIPLGTKVYIEGYGERIATDTGGAINGNIIDCAVSTNEEANNNGIQYRKVFILQ